MDSIPKPQETKGSLKLLPGFLVISAFCFFLPLLLTVFGVQIANYFLPHLIFSLILISASGLVLLTNVITMYSPLRMVVMIALLYPFVVIATYPFSLINLVLVLLILILGLIIPFISLKATTWFYTLGGIFAIPSNLKWLFKASGQKEGEIILANYYKDVYKSRYKDLFFYFPIILFFIVNIMLYISNTKNFALVPLQVISMVGIFGISLAIGLKYKTLQLLPK